MLEAAYAFGAIGQNLVPDLSGNGRNIPLTGTNGVQLDSGGLLDGGAFGKTGADTVTLPAALRTAMEVDDFTIMMDCLGLRSVWWLRFNSTALGAGAVGLLSLDSANIVGRARNQAGGNPTPANSVIGALSATVRHNFAMRYVRSTGVISYFYDGVLTATENHPAGTQLYRGADDIGLGEWASTGPAVDNVRMYSNAVTSGEIAALAGTPVVAVSESAVLAGTTPSPVAALAGDVTADAALLGTIPATVLVAAAEVEEPVTALASLVGSGPRTTAHLEAVSEQDVAPARTSAVLCSSWATVEDLSAAQYQRLAELGLSDADIDAALLRASELLWAFSGRRWMGGGCEEDAVLRSYPPMPGAGTWPYSPSWGHCSCWGYSSWGGGNPARYAGSVPFPHVDRPVAVRLPREGVSSVVSVFVDGVPFTDWEFSLSGWLTRMDGEPWSVCDGDVQVTYQFGTPPPAGGRDAAIELGIEMALDRSGSSECRLPPNAVSVTRQGITMELMSVDRPQYRTALPLVDMWLEAVNPYRRPQSAQVWSPDVPHLTRFGATREA